MDKIKIEILEDGELKITTGEIGETYHRRADDFLKQVRDMMGGSVELTPVKPTEGVVDHEQDAHASA